jgi:predicted MFS family arabinose efflux permease
VAPEARSSAGYTLLLLLLINFLNFLDRALPAVVLEPIRREFGLDDTALGMLNTAFTLVYAAVGLPIGRLADRYPRTRILAFGVLLWSLLTAGTGLAWSFAALVAVRIGVGIGEASCAPASNAMIGDLYPSARRARALGLFMLGLPLGNIVAFAAGGAIAQAYGWRAPFFAAAVPGVLLAALIYFAREPQRGAQETRAVTAPLPVDRPFLRILSIPTVWWIIVSGAAINFAAYAMATFLPAFLARYHGLSIAQAGFVTAIVLGVAGVVGLTGGGVLADRMHLRHTRGRLLLGAVALLVAAPLLWIAFVQPAGAVMTLTVLMAAGWMLYFVYYVTVYSSLQDVIEPQLRATAMAVYFFFMYVLGGALGSTVAGMLSDHYAKLELARAGGGVMTDAVRALGLQASLSQTVPLAILATGIAIWFASRSYGQDAARMQARLAEAAAR